MAGGYDDRDGLIWLDGKLVNWRDANVHLLTHAMHYASSVFEGERAYNGKIFKSREHSKRLLFSGQELDIPIPYSIYLASSISSTEYGIRIRHSNPIFSG